MAVATRTVEYTHGGIALEGFLAWDDRLPGPRPAVAVAHTWAGRGQFECDRAVRIAGLGYVGFALDVYGKGKLGGNVEENAALMQPLMADRSLLQARLSAGIEAMQQQVEADASNSAAAGFCFGGLCALDLARIGAPVRGVVSFHGLFKAPGNTVGKRISARVLALHGYDDPMVPPQDVLALAEEMTAAGADWQLHVYGNTLHGFTNPAANDHKLGAVYNPLAERRAWQAAENFFAEIFA